MPKWATCGRSRCSGLRGETLAAMLEEAQREAGRRLDRFSLVPLDPGAP